MLLARDLPVTTGDDEQPHISMRLGERNIVSVRLRCPDDSMTNDELVARAWEYGWPRTCVYRLGSGYLALLYWTTMFGERKAHIYIEPWCLLSTLDEQNLAPGACINFDTNYVSVSEDPIAPARHASTATHRHHPNAGARRRGSIF